MSIPAFHADKQHQELRESIRDLAEKHIAPHAAEVDSTARFPSAALRALVGSRMHAPHIPAAYGGEGADAVATAIVVEEVARCCVSSSLIPNVNKVATQPLLLAGTEEQRHRYLPLVAQHGALASFALSEADAGSDVLSMTTTATQTDGGWVIRGAKRWISHAGLAAFYVVFAVTDPDERARRISAFLVEKSDPGISFGAPERKIGVRGSVTSEVYLDDVEVPADRLIGERGDGTRLALETLDQTRVTIAAQAVGLAQGALDLATDYVRNRHQFGRPLSDLQGIQFMVADMAIKVEAARCMTYVAAARADAGHSSLSAAAAAAKCFASDTAMAVTSDAVQLLGGNGLVQDYPAERMMRDAKVTQIYEGTNQIQRLIVARNLMAESEG